MFSVEQETKSRLIFDLRALNEYCLDPTFSMETLANLPSLAIRAKYMLKMDLRSAYWQYPVAPEVSNLLGTSDPSDADSLHRWTTLPFGLARSPIIWCSLIHRFVTTWRTAGIRIMAYVDDIIILAESHRELAEATEMVVDDLMAAGIRISAEKSHIRPYTVMDFLGLTVDLQAKAFVITDKKLQNIQDDARALLKEGPPTDMRDVQSFLGRVAFAAVACPWLTYFRAALNGRTVPGGPPVWSNEEAAELRWWAGPAMGLLGGRRWEWKRTAATRLYARFGTAPLPDYYAASDASDTGVGLRYGTAEILHEPLPPWLPPDSPSTARELYGIVRLIERAAIPKGSVLRMACDNTGAVATANGASVCASTARVARRLFRAMLEADITIQIEWIPRELMDDVDSGSRMDAEDMAHAQVSLRDREKIMALAFGGMEPDTLLFSAAHNRWAKKAAFGSRHPEPGSVGDGVGTEQWEKMTRGWAYPPFPLAPATIRRAQSMDPPPRAVLILPDTPYNRIALNDWTVVEVQKVLAPPEFTREMTPHVPIAAFISPTLQTSR